MGDRTELLEIGEAVKGKPWEAPVAVRDGKLAAAHHGDAHRVPAGVGADLRRAGAGGLLSAYRPLWRQLELDPRHARVEIAEIGQLYRPGLGVFLEPVPEIQKILAPV